MSLLFIKKTVHSVWAACQRKNNCVDMQHYSLMLPAFRAMRNSPFHAKTDYGKTIACLHDSIFRFPLLRA